MFLLIIQYYFDNVLILTYVIHMYQVNKVKTQQPILISKNGLLGLWIESAYPITLFLIFLNSFSLQLP